MRTTLTPLVVLLITFWSDWHIALIVLVFLPLVAMIYWWVDKLGRAADIAVHQATADASDRMVEFT